MTSPDDTTSVSGLSFADPRAAQRVRDAVRRIATNQVVDMGSNPNVGRVLSVDIARLTAAVWMPGDTAPIQVNLFPGEIPLDLGDYRTTSAYDTSTVGTGGLVYIENFRGRPYITRILSGGEYALNASVAGLTHRMFSADYQGSSSLPPISPTDIYERQINVVVNPGDGFVTGNALLVGPWSGRNDGSMIDGIVELTLTYWVTTQLKNQVRKYQFSISDRMVVDLEGDEGNKSFWMRLLPETNLGTNPHAELAVDVALVKSGIRTNLEFWFRLVPLDTWSDQSVYFMSVKTYGSAFNVGDPRTGRLVMIKQTVAEPVQGWVGFHNAGIGFTERDEYATYPKGTWYQNDEWSSGSWRSAALRAANDLRWTWHTDGQWTWYNDTNSLFWEGSIVMTGIGPNWNGLHNGYVNIGFPTSGVQIYPSDNTNFTSQYRNLDTFGRLPLNAGETLYWGLAPGLGSGGQGNWHDPRNLFFIVDSKTYTAAQHNFGLPEWAIPICTRSYWSGGGTRRELMVHNIQTALDFWDQTVDPPIDAWYTTIHSGIVGGDETETMTMNAYKWRAKTAYEVFFKCGISATSVPSGINFRLKKGTKTGADLGEFFRYPLVVSGSVHGAQGRLIVFNDTTSDITASITLTGQSTGGAGVVNWNRFASSSSPSYLMARAIGNSNRYYGVGAQI